MSGRQTPGRVLSLPSVHLPSIGRNTPWEQVANEGPVIHLPKVHRKAAVVPGAKPLMFDGFEKVI